MNNPRGRRAVAEMQKSVTFPSSPRRGGRDLNKISRSLLYGADGVVIKFHRILLRLNTTYYWLRAIALAFAPLIPVCASYGCFAAFY